MSTKNNHVHWKQIKHNPSEYPSKHHSTQHHISVRKTYVLNTIPKQTKNTFKLPKLPMTLQRCVQTHFPPTVEQPLEYKYSISTVSISSVLNQRLHITRQPLDLSETDCQKTST